MILKILILFAGILTIGIIQSIVNMLVFRENITKGNIIPQVLPTLVFAFCAALFFTIFDFFPMLANVNIIYIAIITSSFIMSYWFYVAPIFQLIKRKSHQRDYLLEQELAKNNYNFKIILSDEVVSNAYATGGLPYLSIIIIAKNLKDILNHEELMAVVYHEVGHHKHKHIFKLFCINVFLNTLCFLAFDVFYKMEIQQPFEVIGVGLLGALVGLVFYYIPNKFLFYCEYNADSFAVSQVELEAMANALIKMNNETQGKLDKGNINHPSLNLRLKNIRNAGIFQKYKA